MKFLYLSVRENSEVEVKMEQKPQFLEQWRIMRNKISCGFFQDFSKFKFPESWQRSLFLVALTYKIEILKKSRQ